MSGVDAPLEALSAVFAGIGALFFFAGTLGILRLPDFYARTHAATKCDTVGAGSLLLALAIHTGADISTLKILVLATLVLVSSPTSGHALARAAHRTGLAPWYAPQEDERA
jgi:monovalent cation/proton antiporter MnhG/PhaG subunit